MGFHIPDSPPRRSSGGSVSASSQTTMAATAPDANATAVPFSERFSSRRLVRRRNAIIPTLSIDVVGSPRSPSICLSRDNRFALSQQHDQTQQTAIDATSSTSSDEYNNRGSSGTKRAPGIRRRSDVGNDDNSEASFGSRASLNTRDTP